MLDWSGRYVWRDDGTVDVRATQANGVDMINPAMQKVPALVGKTLDDAKKAYADFCAFMRSPNKLEFAEAITRLSFHCGMQSKDPRAVQMAIEDYFEDFGHYPLTLIKKACAIWRNKTEGNNFLPSSGQFKEMMRYEYHHLKIKKERLNKLAHGA